MPARFDCFEYERVFSRSDLIQMFRSVARKVTDTRKVAIAPVYIAIDIAIDVAIASLFTLRLMEKSCGYPETGFRNPICHLEQIRGPVFLFS